MGSDRCMQVEDSYFLSLSNQEKLVMFENIKQDLKTKMTEAEKKVAQSAAGFLGTHLEIQKIDLDNCSKNKFYYNCPSFLYSICIINVI